MKYIKRLRLIMMTLCIMIFTVGSSFAGDFIDIVKDPLMKGIGSDAVKHTAAPGLQVAGMIVALVCVVIIVIIVKRALILTYNTAKGKGGDKWTLDAAKDLLVAFVAVVLIGGGIIFSLFAVAQKIIEDSVPNILETEPADDKDDKSSRFDYVDKQFFS